MHRAKNLRAASWSHRLALAQAELIASTPGAETFSCNILPPKGEVYNMWLESFQA